MFLIRRNKIVSKLIVCRHFGKPASATAADQTTSSQIEKREQLSENEIQKIINLDNIHIVTRFQTKGPQRAALLKNFFIGLADQDLLAYPEVIEIKDYEKLTERLKPHTEYFKQAVVPGNDVSDEMLNAFRRLKLFGWSISQQFAGEGYFKSETLLASECEAIDLRSALIISGHRLAAEAISEHGTAHHREEYLMDLAKGNLIGAVCVEEPNLFKSPSIKATPVTPGLTSEWILNGSKSYVVKSSHANLLVVMAETVRKSESDKTVKELMTFVLDAKTPGITVTTEEEKIGCNQVPFCTINFNNVLASDANILSLKCGDYDVNQKLVQNSRIQSATIISVQIRNFLKVLIEYAVNSYYGDEKMLNLNMIRLGLSKLACDLYALESMIYLTTGLIDSYENQDVDFETAATKAFAHDCLQHMIRLALNFTDLGVTVRGHSFDESIRNAIQLLSYGEQCDIVKLYLGQAGVSYCAEKSGGNIKSYRDTWFNRWLSDSKLLTLNPSLYLNEYMHPSFDHVADALEKSIGRLHAGCQILLSQYGDQAYNRQKELITLGEHGVNTYAMFASAARASRSYCIGLRYNMYETVAAFATNRTMHNHILTETFKLRDEKTEHLDIAERILKKNDFGAFPTSLLTKSK